MDWWSESWWIFVLLAFILIGLAAWYAEVQGEKRRTEQLGESAGRLGFEFEAEPDAEFSTRIAGFSLLAEGHARKARNVARRRISDLNVALFDFRYTTGGGKTSHTWKQTVLLIESGRLRLSDFTLRPKGFWDGVAATLGKRSIELEAYPSFAASYRLDGSDRDQVSALFEPVAGYFLKNKDWWIEGHEDQLLVYRRAQRLNPDAAQIAAFLRKGLDVVSLWLQKQDPVDPVDLLSLELESVAPPDGPQAV